MQTVGGKPSYLQIADSSQFVSVLSSGVLDVFVLYAQGHGNDSAVAQHATPAQTQEAMHFGNVATAEAPDSRLCGHGPHRLTLGFVRTMPTGGALVAASLFTLLKCTAVPQYPSFHDRKLIELVGGDAAIAAWETAIVRPSPELC